MSIKNHTQLNTQLDNLINTNGVEGITGIILNAVLRDIQDSSINKGGDSGILAKLSYSTTHAISNPSDITHKQYVDDAVGAIDLSSYLPKSAGSGQALTDDLYFGNHYATNIVGLLDGSGIAYILGTRELISDSTLPILSFDDIIKGVGFVTAGEITSYIKPTSTTEEQFLLPDKGGAGGTIALTSDLTGLGTVTTVSVVTANGFSGSVANASTTPAITLTLQNASTSQSGQLTATDWNTFNGKQTALSGTGFVKISGTTISYDNSTYLTTAVTSVSGTTNRITSTGGITPVIDISASYVGQASITTLGTIGTGVWQGTAIADTYISSAATWNAKVSSQWITTGSDIYYSTGNVMVGNASAPLTKLHTVETSTNTLRGLLFGQYSSDTLSSQANYRKARGTYSSPTTIVSGDLLSNLNSWAYDGTSFVNAGSIRVTSVGIIGTGRTPTKIDFMTMTDVTTGVLTTALTLDQTQKGTFANTVEVTTLSVKDFGSGLYTSALNSVAAGQLQLGGTSTGFTRINAPNSFYMFDGGSTPKQTIVTSGTVMTLGGGWPTLNVSSLTNYTSALIFNTSSSIVSVNGLFTGVSSTGIGSGFLWSPTINQTGGTGMAVGFNATPTTLTSVTNAIAGFYSNIAVNPTGGGVGYAQYHAGTGSHYFGDSNMIFGTSTGLKHGTSTSQKQSWWGATPIVQPSGANQAAITDSTTGTAAFTLVDVGLAFSQANINNNFASLLRFCMEVRTVLVNTGLWKGAV